VYLLSNYDEGFEVESVVSREGLIEVLEQKKIDSKRYKFTLKITPPPREDRKRLFRDTLTVKIKGGESLAIPLAGYYQAAAEGQAK
jgi:hypothetical protein